MIERAFDLLARVLFVAVALALFGLALSLVAATVGEPEETGLSAPRPVADLARRRAGS